MTPSMLPGDDSALWQAMRTVPEKPAVYTRRSSIARRPCVSAHRARIATTFGSRSPSLNVLFELATMKP